MLGFAKYLDRTQADVTVITEHPDKRQLREDLFDTVVYRVGSKRILKKAVFIAGENRLRHLIKVAWNMSLNMIRGPVDHNWLRNSLAVLEKIHSEHPVDVIISSYAPAEPHLLAGAFIGKHPEVKWIADMRDEMSLNPHLDKRQQGFLSKVERIVNRHATAVTSVSGPILDDFKKLLPDVKLFDEVRNGFDHELTFEYSFNRVFTICYCGTFYGQRKPDSFFAGLSDFLQKHPVEVEIRLVGVHKNIYIPPALQAAVKFIPPCTPEEAVREMAAADANLLVLPKVSGKGVFSGKIFEYLSVRKPIIAVVDPEDVAAELINALNAGFVADFEDVPSISLAIEHAFLLWKNNSPINSSPDKISALHRKYEVAKLNTLIQTIIAS